MFDLNFTILKRFVKIIIFCNDKSCVDGWASPMFFNLAFIITENNIVIQMGFAHEYYFLYS